VRDQSKTVKAAGWIGLERSKTKKTGKKEGGLVRWSTKLLLSSLLLPSPTPPPPLYPFFDLVRKSLKSQWWTGGFGFAIRNPAGNGMEIA
jgi:hypothetical protein